MCRFCFEANTLCAQNKKKLMLEIAKPFESARSQHLFLLRMQVHVIMNTNQNRRHPVRHSMSKRSCYLNKWHPLSIRRTEKKSQTYAIENFIFDDDAFVQKYTLSDTTNKAFRILYSVAVSNH